MRGERTACPGPWMLLGWAAVTALGHRGVRPEGEGQAASSRHQPGGPGAERAGHSPELLSPRPPGLGLLPRFAGVRRNPKSKALSVRLTHQVAVSIHKPCLDRGPPQGLRSGQGFVQASGGHRRAWAEGSGGHVEPTARGGGQLRPSPASLSPLHMDSRGFPSRPWILSLFPAPLPGSLGLPFWRPP